MYSLKYAWCALRSNRLCSLIGILGLAFGLACVMIISKQIKQELYTDHFHTKIDRIYCLMVRKSAQDQYALRGYWTTDLLYRQYPQAESAVNIRSFKGEDITHDQSTYQADVLVVDSTFGSVFSFPMLSGDIHTALASPNQVVITEKLAKQVFGQSCPQGETLIFWGFPYQVAGVLKDLPVNSSFSFDVLVPTREEYYTRMPSSWLLMREGNDLSTAVMPENTILYPFQKLYFDEYVNKEFLPTLRTGDTHTLWILGWIGLVIFVICVFNYINIYQVILLKRGRELAVKKVLGTNNRLLYGDFWCENFLRLGISVLLSCGIILLISGFLYQKLGLMVAIDWHFDPLFLGGILMGLPTLIAIGAWWKYYKVGPSDAMRSGYMGVHSRWLRKVLLSSQYVMTTLMIIVALYFIRQLDFMLNQDMGLRQENVVQLPLFKNIRYAIENDQREVMNRFWSDYKYVCSAMMTNPDLQYVCQGNFPLSVWMHGWRNTEKEPELIQCATNMVKPEYLPMFGLEMKEGRFFDHELGLYDRKKVIVNESALKFFNIKDWRNTRLSAESWGEYEIIGIVKDFRFEHVAKNLQPLVLLYSNDHESPFLMHIVPGKEKAALDFLRQLHDRVNPGSEFTYRFFEDEVKGLYVDDRRTVMLFSVFTIVAMLISAFGLFGFSVFDMQQRYREIALHKVNGATLGEILLKLVRRFMLLILFSFLVACPLAWWIIQKYMEHFSLSAPLTGWLFAIAMLVTLGITFLTLIGQSYRAASENPVKALKNE